MTLAALASTGITNLCPWHAAPCQPPLPFKIKCVFEVELGSPCLPSKLYQLSHLPSP